VLSKILVAFAGKPEAETLETAAVSGVAAIPDTAHRAATARERREIHRIRFILPKIVLSMTTTEIPHDFLFCIEHEKVGRGVPAELRLSRRLRPTFIGVEAGFRAGFIYQAGPSGACYFKPVHSFARYSIDCRKAMQIQGDRILLGQENVQAFPDYLLLYI
jgi:hypothetical protein